MIYRRKPTRGAAYLLPLIAFLAVCSGRAMAAPVDVMVLVNSDGKGLDQVSITYNGRVAEQQARQDLQTLSTSLNRPAADVRISTKRITPRAPEMTSVEARLPEIVNLAEGTLAVQPFVEAYRRFSHLSLIYQIEPPFKLTSPAKPLNRGDVRMTVDNQGGLVSYDVQIRHIEGGAARIPALDGSGPWARLMAPVLFLAVLVAAAIGVAVFVLVRRGGAERASTG